MSYIFGLGARDQVQLILKLAEEVMRDGARPFSREEVVVALNGIVSVCKANLEMHDRIAELEARVVEDEEEEDVREDEGKGDVRPEGVDGSSGDVWRFYECSNPDCPSKQRDALHYVLNEYPTGCVANVRLHASIEEPDMPCPVCGKKMAYEGYVLATESGHIPDRGPLAFGEHGHLSGGEMPCGMEDGEDRGEPFDVHMTFVERDPETGGFVFVRHIDRADGTEEQISTPIPESLASVLQEIETAFLGANLVNLRHPHVKKVEDDA